MFGLVRLMIFCAVSFVAGVLYERYNAVEACKAVGGVTTGGMCMGKDARQ